MEEATVLVPVTCPQCGIKSLSEQPIIVVVTALTRWNRMLLRALCHEEAWDATPAELEAIREYLGAAWIEQHRNSSATD